MDFLFSNFSQTVQTLKVLLEGKPVMQNETDPVLGPIQRVSTGTLLGSYCSYSLTRYRTLLVYL